MRSPVMRGAAALVMALCLALPPAGAAARRPSPVAYIPPASPGIELVLQGESSLRSASDARRAAQLSRALDIARRVIARRLQAGGYWECLVERQGADRLHVIANGSTDQVRLIALVTRPIPTIGGELPAQLSVLQVQDLMGH